MNRKYVPFALLAVFIGILTLFLAINFSPPHSSPEYSVESHDALVDRLDGLCVLPNKDTYNNSGSSYTVLLKSRYSNIAIGYLIDAPSTAGKANAITIGCKALSALPEESRVVNPTNSYQNVGLDIESNHISFLLNGYRYDIHHVDGDDQFAQTAKAIAESIIDNFYLN